ncbi:MAG: hypothetical protein HY578_09930 [Nitrospinae bacterium]|nr:hypothetical protein [Nitrospinota bacterium]
MNKLSEKDIRIEWHGYLYTVDRDRLIISKGIERIGEFCLAPKIEGKTTNLIGWKKEKVDHFSCGIDAGGHTHLSIEHGHVCYWMESKVKQFENLTYFPESSFYGNHWQTYVSDEHDKKWDVNVDAEVLISSAYADVSNVDGADGAGMTDPGDMPPTWIWNIPVRAVSFGTKYGWLGVSIPGALPVGVTRLKMQNQKFSMTFQVLRPACKEGGMPRIYFITGLPDAYAVLDEHRIISDRLGLTVKKPSKHPHWWTNPLYYYWDEYSRRLKENPEFNKEGLKTKDLLEWLEYTRKSTRVPEINIPLEQYCYNCYGDYAPVKGLGGAHGLRETIDKMRKKGVRFAYYIHPYMFNTKIEFFKKHPEAFCKPKDKRLKLKYALERNEDEPEYALIDWTHPRGREYILNWVEFILSDKPGCLNADILRHPNSRGPDTRAFNFYNPDWGIGDLMTMKVQKLIYEKAKEIKPDCMVSKSGFADCYMQPWADADILCEEWNGNTAAWYRRGQIVTRTVRDTIFETDPWFVTLTKGYEYYMCMLVWGYPETNAVKHAIHPYIYYRELKEKDYRRRRAGFQVYLNAPINITDICQVEWNNGDPIIWRKRTQGVLNGWYAALAISKRCFVTYSKNQALIASSETRKALIPIPPDTRIIKMEKISHDGKITPWEYSLVKKDNDIYVEARIEDCGYDTMYSRIRYTLR